jgi:hypothetical protein
MTSNFKPKTQARTNIILPAINENGKQQSAESPATKPKKDAVAFAELINEALGIRITFGVDVVQDVCMAIKSMSFTHSRMKFPS